jgi:hypothetical protein
MTPAKWNILAGALADLRFTEKRCKTRRLSKERCVEIADALNCLMEDIRINGASCGCIWEVDSLSQPGYVVHREP